MTDTNSEGIAPARKPSVCGCPIRHVLVCLDHSEFDDKSIAAAVALVEKSSARVTLLHVLEPSVELGSACPTDPLAWEVGRQEARAYLNRLRAVVEASGIKCQVKIVEGQASECITSEMRRDEVDLTVLARHGKRGVDDWSMSSTAQRVLARGAGSVLVVPTQSQARTSWKSSPRRVLVPLDGSVRAECALALARTIAAAHGAELILVHVVDEPYTAPQPWLECDDTELVQELTDRWERSARRYLGRFLAELRPSGSKVRHVVERSGDVRLALLDVARRESADLVVLSAHGVTCNPERPYGSVAEHLIHYCDRPLLLVQVLQFAIPDCSTSSEHAEPPIAEGRLS